MLDKINLWTSSPIFLRGMKWVALLMMYGSFLFPIIWIATQIPSISSIMPRVNFKDFGSLAWGSLIAIMLIRPLADLIQSFGLLRRLVGYRRQIGIFSGMAALTHGLGYVSYLDFTWMFASVKNLYVFFGLLALIFSIVLLITSNSFSVKLLGRGWKIIQEGVYGMFFFACLHVAFIRYPHIDYPTLFIGSIIPLIRIFVWWRKRPKNREASPIANNGDEYSCNACGYIYDENKGDPDGGIKPGTRWEDIPDSWHCPVCGVGKNEFTKIIRKSSTLTSSNIPTTTLGSASSGTEDDYLKAYERPSDTLEPDFRSIYEKAKTGKEEISAMGTHRNYRNLWEDILFLPAQLAHRVYDEHELEPDLTTIIGPKAKFPITLKLPFYISHMSFGSLSREAKIALAKGSKMAGTMICSGEGGLLPPEQENAGIYIFEYSTGRFGATEENMKKADGIEIKIGQAAKAGLGGHLMGPKVTEEIAAVRGVEPWKDVISPANHTDIQTKEDLRDRVTYLRDLSGGKPIGIKIVASHIEDDLEVALFCKPDFITIDCRGGATGAAPTHVKDNVCIPAPYAVYRARKYLDEKGVGRDVTLCITGGFRTSADITKAIAMGADAVAVSTVAMIGIGCQQYRVCHKGTCPVGIATQNPDLRKRLDMYKSAEMLARLFHVYKREISDFVRILAKKGVHDLDSSDLTTISSEISEFTDVRHA